MLSYCHNLLLPQTFISGLVVLGIVSLSVPSYAGQWSFSETSSGSKSPFNPPDTADWAMPRPQGLPPQAPWSYTQKNAITNLAAPAYSQKTATTSGTINLICKWTPDYTGEELPATISFLVTASASGGVDYNPNSIPSSSGSADNGVGVPVSVEVVPFGTGESMNWVSTGKRLYKVQRDSGTQNANGSVAWTLPIAMSASVTASGSSATLHAAVAASAAFDPRTVQISSASIENSYRRTMVGTYPTSKYRNGALPVPFVIPMVYEKGAGLLNERNGDGSFVVDSVAKWDAPSQQWMAQGIYTGNTPNFSVPSYRWTWSGGTVTSGVMQDRLAANNSQVDINPFSGPFFDLNGIMLGGNFGGAGMMSQSTLTLEATDNDGAFGKNTYTVNWHRPYEKLTDLADSTNRKDVYWVSPDPLPDGGGVSTVEVPAKEFDYMAAIDDVLVVTKTTGLPTDEITELLGLFKALTNISNWGETAPAITITDTTILHNEFAYESAVRERPENIEGMTVEERDRLIATNPFDDSDITKYDCFAARVRYHHRKNVLADQYDIHGFAAPNVVLSTDVTDRYQWDTFYMLKTPAPIPPTLGDREIPPSYNFG